MANAGKTLSLSTVKVGDRLCWRHRNSPQLSHLAQPGQLERTVTVKAIFGTYLKTDDGDYFIHSGCNVDAPCGCNRLCNCWGTVTPLGE